MLSLPSLHIGTSGWNYTEWRGPFYPKGLTAHRWLAFYAGVVDPVEISATFYGMPRPETVRKWRDTVPEGFLCAVKGNRFVTRLRRLVNFEEPLQRFMDMAGELGPKLGPILWQFPPGFAFDADRVAPFLASLPSGKRYVLEARHDSWLQEECQALLREHNVAWRIADTPDYPYAEFVTADFAYIRLHGHEHLCGSLYSPKDLQRWAANQRLWQAKGEMFISTSTTPPAAAPSPLDRIILVSFFTLS